MGATHALALCVHHKPWLAMSTVVTALLQDDQAFDIHFVHNLGDGNVGRASYACYRKLMNEGEHNTHLSPYDPQVRAVCQLNLDRAAAVEYENDHTLDSGAFYKFIRDRRWAPYEQVLFAGEGTLFARPNVLAAMLRFARLNQVHFIASGHEKRRLPKNLMLHYYGRYANPTPMDRFHDEMIRDTFAVFCRDPVFRRLFEAWSSDFAPQTEHHVPAIPPRTAFGRRVRAAVTHRFEALYGLDAFASWASVRLGRESFWPSTDSSMNGSGDDRMRVDGVAFHRVCEPEWFGCTPILFLSRTFLERLAERLERFRMYDVLDLPFAATGLEVIWGFLPAWLGFDKWFTDGFHRVRKDFVTYRREDHPPDMASYINRYHRGRVSVGWDREHVKLRALKRDLSWMRDALPAAYF